MAGTTRELELSGGRSREWVDDVLSRTIGLDPRRLRAASASERLQAFETFQAGFDVDVDEVSGERTVKSRTRATTLDSRRIRSAELAALAVRVEILITDAQERLNNVSPILAQPDTMGIEASRRVISSAFVALLEAFAHDPWDAVVDLLFDQLLKEDEYGREGELGLLGELTGLIEPHRVQTASDEQSYIAYRAIFGHVECARRGWESLRDQPSTMSFSQASREIIAHADCIEQHARALRDVLEDDCLDITLEDDDDLTMGVLISDTIRRSAEWRAAARQGRTELLAIKPFVEMLAEKFQQFIDSEDVETDAKQATRMRDVEDEGYEGLHDQGLLRQHLDDEAAERAERLSRKLAAELADAAAVLDQLAEPAEADEGGLS